MVFCCAFQLVDMDAGQKEWLAEHLGHEFNIHKNNYVLQEPIIELAKISRLLIAVEAGDAAMFVGKKLQDISTEGLLLSSFVIVLVNEFCVQTTFRSTFVSFSVLIVS